MEILFKCCHLYDMICTCINSLPYLLLYMYTNVEYTYRYCSLYQCVVLHILFFLPGYTVVCDFQWSNI